MLAGTSSTGGAGSFYEIKFNNPEVIHEIDVVAASCCVRCSFSLPPTCHGQSPAAAPANGGEELVLRTYEIGDLVVAVPDYALKSNSSRGAIRGAAAFGGSGGGMGGSGAAEGSLGAAWSAGWGKGTCGRHRVLRRLPWMRFATSLR